MSITPSPLSVKKLVSGIFFVVGFFHSVCVFSAAESAAHNNNAITQRELDNATANNAPFGRIFTTPAARARLDLLRQQQGFSKPIITSLEVDTKDIASPVAQPQSFKLSGIMLRADGQQQVWINGKLQPQQQTRGANSSNKMVMPTSAALRVPIKKQDQSVTLKPGQVWNPHSRKTTESYLLPANKPPQIEVPADVKKSVQKKAIIPEKPAAEPVEKTEVAPESTKAQ